MFIDEVNEKSGGALEIVIAGGPEVVAPPDAPKAVQSGAIPIANVLTSLADMIVPGLRVLTYNELPYKQMRKNADGYINEICHKAGIHYLGQAKPMPPQTMLNNYTIKQIKTVDDFKGITMGSPSPSTNPFFEALGCTPFVLPFTEYFAGLERGVIGGINFSTEDVPAFGLDEILKCVIDHPYHSSADIFIVNLDVWNSLPKNLQNVLTEANINLENNWGAYYDKEIRAPAREKMKQAGMTFVKFSKEDEAKYYDLYRDAQWGAAIAKHPEVAGTLKPLITKK
jgi:TRAP-type C4-dicarboxylate transport system substrate-binding protein